MVLTLAAGSLGAMGFGQSPATNLNSAPDKCWTERAWPECNDGDPINGYFWPSGGSWWVPGLPTLDSWFAGSPIYAIGNAVFYSPYSMEGTARVRGLSLDGYVDGVSGLSCADVGLEVWIRRPGYSWEGPFLNVDCAQRNDMYGAVAIRGEVIEVGFTTAERWGMAELTNDGYRVLKWRLEDVEVSKLPPAYVTGEPEHLPTWWLERLEFVTPAEYAEELRNGWTRPWFEADHSWRLRGEWVNFAQPTRTAIPIPTPTLYSGEYRSPGLSALATAMSITATADFASSPTVTPTPNFLSANLSEEVVDKRSTFVVLTILAALFAGLFVTVRDWKRLGGK